MRPPRVVLVTLTLCIRFADWVECDAVCGQERTAFAHLGGIEILVPWSKVGLSGRVGRRGNRTGRVDIAVLGVAPCSVGSINWWRPRFFGEELNDKTDKKDKQQRAKYAYLYLSTLVKQNWLQDSQTTTSTPTAYPKYLLELEKMLGSTVVVAVAAAEVLVALCVEEFKDEEADDRVLTRLVLAEVVCVLAVFVVAAEVDIVAETVAEDGVIDAEAA